MDQPDIRYQEMRDIWNDYNHRQEFEHDLINRKTTWLLTAEAILFAAYGLTFANTAATAELGRFRALVAISGLAIAAAVLVGVLGVINSKRLSWKIYRRFYADPNAHSRPRPLDRGSLPWGVHTQNTWVTLVPDGGIPFMFIGAWAALLAGIGPTTAI